MLLPHMKRNFASLTPQEALHLALRVEQRNGHLYRQFAELFLGFGDSDSLEIANVFLDLAEEEHRHGDTLLECYEERFGDAPCAITEDDVHPMIEVPRLPDGSIFAIARAGAATVPQNHALEIALSAETSACRFYSQVVEYTADPDLRSLYTELGEMEQSHVRMITRRMEFLRRQLPHQA